MGERHREPRNGAKELLQRRFFRPVPGLVNWLREPTAHAVGYVVSPSGLGALVAAMPLCGAGNLARNRLSAGASLTGTSARGSALLGFPLRFQKSRVFAGGKQTEPEIPWGGDQVRLQLHETAIQGIGIAVTVA